MEKTIHAGTAQDAAVCAAEWPNPGYSARLLPYLHDLSKAASSPDASSPDANGRTGNECQDAVVVDANSSSFLNFSSFFLNNRGAEGTVDVDLGASMMLVSLTTQIAMAVRSGHVKDCHRDATGSQGECRQAELPHHSTTFPAPLSASNRILVRCESAGCF